MSERFIRAQMLLGDEAMERLRLSHAAVFGLGGVGSWCAEALARSGVGALTVIDEDTVGESNINRQLIAVEQTLGVPKAEAMRERLLQINPELAITAIARRYEASTRENFFGANYDYIIDAIDLVACKLDLIMTAREKGIPIISALGTGNKADLTKLQIADISKTQGCPLARVVRKELRERGVTSHTVVYSAELPMKPAQPEAPPPGRRSVPGSLVWVPAAAGLLLAQHVVCELAGKAAGELQGPIDSARTD